MCGIAGFLTLDSHARPSVERVDELTRMIDLIGHRGPDEAGYYVDDYAALASACLSILDLAHGVQPMSDTEERYWICYNGEIYNYKELRADLRKEGCRFRTESDTEVALNAWIAWGHDSLRWLNGGFAFAIYDRKKRTCILARDRFGKRPLYYAPHGGGVLFASEMKAFLAAKDFSFTFDPAQIASIFSVWVSIGDQSGYLEIQQVPAGHFLLVSPGRRTLHEFASRDMAGPAEKIDFQDAQMEVRERLTSSVRLRLRSDVEVGAYLSGGLDSTITTRLMWTVSKRFPCASKIRTMMSLMIKKQSEMLLAFASITFESARKTLLQPFRTRFGTRKYRSSERHSCQCISCPVWCETLASRSF